MNILCVGMMACDIPLYPVTKDLFDREQVRIPDVKITTGGDALNVAATLGKLGIKAAVLGRVGADVHGRYIVDVARQNGIDVSGVVWDREHATNMSYHLIGPKGDRHVIACVPLFEVLDSTDVPDQAIQGSGIVYFGSALTFRKMDDHGTLDLFRRAHRFGAVTAMDASLEYLGPSGPAEFENLKKTLQETDIFLPSIAEAAYLTGTDDPKEIATRMEPFGMKVFGIKLGARGCYLTDFREEYHLGSFDAFKPLDTTGAGDSFVGGFLCGWSKGWSLERCGVFANVVASHNVAQLGATGGVPTFEQAAAYLESHEAAFQKNRYQ